MALGVGGTPASAPDRAASEENHTFTGEILPVFFVSDVQRSAAFYSRVLGFRFDYFYDYDSGEESTEWTRPEPPIWASMHAGDLKFGLHLADDPYERRVGGSIHYFRVRDVEAHHRRVAARGGEPGPLVDKPWMRMFLVLDPDGHKLFFFTPPAQR